MGFDCWLSAIAPGPREPLNKQITRKGSHRLRRCDLTRLCRPVVHKATVPLRVNLAVRAKGDRHARVAEPVARPMVLQVPRRVRPEVQEARDLWPPEASDRGHPAGAVRAA